MFPMRILIQVFFGIFLLAASVQDVRTRRIRLAWMLLGPAVVVILRLLTEKGDYIWTSDFFLSAACGAVFVAISWFAKGRFGMADGLSVLGIFLCCGYQKGMRMVFLGFLIAGIAAGILLLRRKVGRNTAIPFLPFLFAGYLAGMFLP